MFLRTFNGRKSSAEPDGGRVTICLDRLGVGEWAEDTDMSPESGIPAKNTTLYKNNSNKSCGLRINVGRGLMHPQQVAE